MYLSPLVDSGGIEGLQCTHIGGRVRQTLSLHTQHKSIRPMRGGEGMQVREGRRLVGTLVR